MKKNPWKQLSSRFVYRTPWFKIRKDRVVRPDGKRGEYHVIVTTPGVFVVALTPQGQVYLVGLYRYTTGKFSWEIPGGGSDGENPLQAAKRELWEETGLRAKKWKRLGSWQAWNGPSSETDFVFLAQELECSGTGRAKEEGIVTVKKVSFKRVFAMIRSGQLTDGQSITALTKAALFLGVKI